MKLAKKMLAGVLALAMVAALALTAFAATSNLTVTATQYAKVGDKITVTVNATDMAGLESADFQFKFDPTALKYVSVDKAANSSYEFYEGDLAEEGLVTWSFYYRNAAEADCGICVITFEVLKDADATVEVIVESWEGTDGLNAPESVTVTKKEETTAAPTTAAPTTAAPTTAAPVVEDESEVPTTGNKIPQTGEAGVAAIAGVMALAAVAFVATRKKDEE